MSDNKSTTPPVEWRTTSVTPLSGWCNIWRDTDGGLFVTPCPGLLTQESGRRERVIAAEFTDNPPIGELVPVDRFGGHVQTVHASQLPDWLRVGRIPLPGVVCE